VFESAHNHGHDVVVIVWLPARCEVALRHMGQTFPYQECNHCIVEVIALPVVATVVVVW